MSDPVPHDPIAALRQPRFRVFLGMRFAVTLAITMQFTALAWWVFEMTRSKWMLGLLGLAEFLPLVVLALPVGEWVERLEKRRVMAGGIAALLAGCLLLMVLHLEGTRDWVGRTGVLAGVCVVVAIGGAVRAFFAPATFTLIGALVPRGQQANAAVWTSSVFLAANVTGPVLGGLLLHRLGALGVQAVVAGFMLAALLLAANLGRHPPPPVAPHETPRQRLFGGLAFVWNNPVVRAALLMDLLAVLFGDAVPLLPAFVQETLKGDAELFGLLRALPGIGSVLAMLAFARWPPRRHTGRLLLAATFCYGLAMIGFGLARAPWLVGTLLLACGALDGVSVVVRQSILQLRTPEGMRGRVGAVNAIFISSSNELGTFVSGGMAAVLGLVPAILTGGGAILAVVLGIGASHPALRKMSLMEDEKRD